MKLKKKSQKQENRNQKAVSSNHEEVNIEFTSFYSSY
jgi:hypothetical protein